MLELIQADADRNIRRFGLLDEADHPSAEPAAGPTTVATEGASS
jgi:hypothetical protein